MHVKTWPKLPVPHPNLRISVVLPMRNESASLDNTLKALSAQQCLGENSFDPTVYAAC
jgi:hypothetical protein